VRAPRPLLWLSRVNSWFARAAGVLAGALLVAMTAIVGASVYFRYVANASLTWSEEATRYLAIWLVFIGAGLAHRWRQHVRIGLLLERLPGRKRHLGELLVELVVLTLFVTIGWFGLKLGLANLERNQLSPAMRIPIGWVYFAVPVGFGLAALQSFERLLWHGYQLLTGAELPERPFVNSPDDELPDEVIG
jgi:TRAP-type C4-dicarboxylate transport system permease small subunit